MAKAENKIDRTKCAHVFVIKNGVFRCNKCKTTIGQWMMDERKIAKLKKQLK